MIWMEVIVDSFNKLLQAKMLWSPRSIPYMCVATVMEMWWNFWNFWNFKNFWNLWKSHGIWTKIDQGHGKVMEFWNKAKKSWKSRGIWPLGPTFCKLALLHGDFSKPELLGFQSWNFVIWSWKSHWKVMEFCWWDFVATLKEPQPNRKWKFYVDFMNLTCDLLSELH